MHQFQIQHPFIIILEYHMTSNSEAKLVQNMREMIPMRFRLTNPKALQNKKKKSGILDRLAFSLKLKTKIEQETTQQKIFALKYCELLSDNYLLIGNEYQLNMLNLTGILQDFVATSSDWTISQDQPITQLFVMNKIRTFFVVCTCSLNYYIYRSEAIEDQPKLEQQIMFSEEIISVCLVRKSILLVFLKNSVEIFQIVTTANSNKLVKKNCFSYHKPNDLQLFSVPDNQSHILSIFFRGKPGKTVTIIHSLKIQCKSQFQLIVGTFQVFCQVPIRYSNTAQIYFYGSNIFILQIGLQLYAIKGNYFLDNITTNTNKMRSFIKYLSNRYFFLFHKERFDYYKYEMDQKHTAAEKFKIQCIDSIPVHNPKGSSFFDVIEMGKRLIFIFHSPKTGEVNQLSFWLGISDPIQQQKKINNLYPQNSQQVEKIDIKSMSQKIQMAQKIGYSSSQAYLQLWLRSNKSTNKDYDILISTQNYDMISEQMAQKFKKTSMKFKQVQNVMVRSLQMLKIKVYGTHCNCDFLRQYATCQFLLCKYQMFKKLKMKQNPSLHADELMVSIQDYYFLISIQLKKQLIEYISQFCQQSKKVELQIRALLTQFSLIYRLHYQQLLSKIITMFKKQFLQLITVIPELLPITASIKEAQEMKGGPWTDIDINETTDYCILDNFQTFQNKKLIQQFKNTKFFKVYQWHTHGVLVDTPSQIKKKVQSINSKAIFILLYEKLYLQKDSFIVQKVGPNKQKIIQNKLIPLIQYIENTYPLLPSHLRGRYFFYEALYDNFKQYHQNERKNFMGVNQFFSLGEDQLFLIYFQKERAKKGIFILKQIKPIYQTKVTNGCQLFLDNMFNFFKFNQSSWSDLKIILNKFNNQKEDFHRSNYKIFQIVVKAIIQKVKVGTDNPEVTLSEVLSYIENIPFPIQDQLILKNLINIQQVRSEQQILKSIKINMTIREILERGEQVIYKMIQYQIERCKVKQVKNQNQLKLYAYKILAEINYRQSSLYMDIHFNFCFKSFLIILMEDQSFIKLCQQLLRDEYLCNQFKVNQKLTENIVIYLYRKRLHANPVYFDSKGYIQQLSNLLDQQNTKRRFIKLSQEYANVFSFQGQKLKYPFFKSYYPRIEQIVKQVHLLSSSQVNTIDYQHLFDVLIQLKYLGQYSQKIQQSHRNQFMNHEGESKQNLMRHQLYMIFFLKYIQHGLIEKAVVLGQKIMRIDVKFDIYNIVIPLFLLEVLMKQLLVRTLEPFVRLISYYFQDRKGLLGLVEQMLNPKNVFSNDSIDQFIELKRQQKINLPIFNPNNIIFSPSLLKIFSKMDTDTQAKNFNDKFEAIWMHIQSHKQQFSKNKIYSKIFRLMLHDPYVNVQYIYRKRGGINVKSFRALLVFMGMQCFFNMQKILQLGQQIFSIFLTKLKTKTLLEDLIDRFSKGQKYEESLPYTDQYMLEQIKLTQEDLIGNSILNFRNKLIVYQTTPIKQLQQEKTTLIKNYNKNDQSPMPLFIYPFEDGDGLYLQPEYDLDISVRPKRERVFQFNEVYERSQLCEHNNYFIKPVFKSDQEENKDFDDFSRQANKKPKLSVLCRSKTEQPMLHHMVSDDLPPINLPFDITQNKGKGQEHIDANIQNKNNEGSFMRKSQSMNMVQKKQKDEQVYQPMKKLSSMIPLMIATKKTQQLNPSDLLRQQISDFLNGKDYFDQSVLPPLITQQQISNFVQTIFTQIYRNQMYPLLNRISLIWQLKRCIFGQQSIEIWMLDLTLALGRSHLLHSLLTPIQDIFTQVMFTQEFTTQTFLQLIKQNISEFVVHEQDMMKIGNIVGQVFFSESAQDEVLMLFLIKLCRNYAVSHQERQKNHFKDQILFIQQNINQKEINKVIKLYSESKNQDLKNISKTMQYFKNYTQSGSFIKRRGI